ncbi:MAG: hypothetical protein KGJ06_06110 [Pseudomonadota bacterium]|nr:hypothetical protein [Pseudomonadota bacterium]
MTNPHKDILSAFRQELAHERIVLSLANIYSAAHVLDPLAGQTQGCMGITATTAAGEEKINKVLYGYVEAVINKLADRSYDASTQLTPLADFANRLAGEVKTQHLKKATGERLNELLDKAIAQVIGTAIERSARAGRAQWGLGTH